MTIHQGNSSFWNEDIQFSPSAANYSLYVNSEKVYGCGLLIPEEVLSDEHVDSVLQREGLERGNYIVLLPQPSSVAGAEGSAVMRWDEEAYAHIIAEAASLDLTVVWGELYHGPGNAGESRFIDHVERVLKSEKFVQEGFDIQEANIVRFLGELDTMAKPRNFAALTSASAQVIGGNTAPMAIAIAAGAPAQVLGDVGYDMSSFAKIEHDAHLHIYSGDVLNAEPQQVANYLARSIFDAGADI
jgi:hypothetical protein